MAKLTIKFDDDSLIKEMADRYGVKNTELIRRALSVYKYLNDEVAKGNVVSIVDDNHDVVKEIEI